MQKNKLANVTGDVETIKVAHIGANSVSNITGGIDFFILELSKSLFSKGIRSDIYSKSNFCSKSKCPSNLNEIAIFNSNVKFTTIITYYPLASLKAALSDANIVHYHDLNAGLFSFIPKMFGKKVIFTMQMFDWITKYDFLSKLSVKILSHLSSLINDRFVLVSTPLYDYYKKKGKDVTYIANGTKIPALSKTEPKEKYILFCSRLDPEKGAHYLINAFNSLKTKHGYKLYICGDSLQHNAYYSELKNMSSSNVIFLGWVSGKKKNDLFKNASLYVLPSEIEGMSFSLLEAMSYGIPVVVSDIKENKDVVEQNGFYFKSKDVTSLHNTLNYVIEHPEIRKKKGQNARISIKESFSWESVSKKYASVYKKIINHPEKKLKDAFA